jgi:3-methyladenine DNA glycosylase AlkD
MEMDLYLADLHQKFAKHRNSLNAVAMKKYMKGQFEYFGIKSPLRREIITSHIAEMGIPGDDEFESVLYECWSMPEREFQYFAMELAGRVAKKAELCRIDMYVYMAERKSWWDTVDYIASNLVGVHFKQFPDAIIPYTERWMDSENIWLQRVSILFQLKYKNSTDLTLLTRSIDRLSGSKEFFINKAIGWILREYSKTDPGWVTDYVSTHAKQLAPLSKREALKWIDNQTKKHRPNHEK